MLRQATASMKTLKVKLDDRFKKEKEKSEKLSQQKYEIEKKMLKLHIRRIFV